MHAKNAMMGITQPHIVTDTCNWTGGALSNPKWLPVAINDESILMINCTKSSGYKHLGVEFTSNFLALLRSYQNQPLNSNQPKVQAIVDTLVNNVKVWRKITISFELQVDEESDGDAASIKNDSYVLLLRSVEDDGGKNWSLLRHLKQVTGKNTWTTDGTEPIDIPQGRTFNYIYGRISDEHDNSNYDNFIVWEKCKHPRYLISDPAFPNQKDVVKRNVDALTVDVVSKNFC